MLPNWSADCAALVADLVSALRDEPASDFHSTPQLARRTNGLPVYGDLGGVIALTSSGDLVLYDFEKETVTPVRDDFWQEVGIAYLGRHYPQVRDLLVPRPAHARACPDCSGSGWVLDGRMYCRSCRGSGWVA